MDKELVKGTRGLAADEFIVGESGKIRGTGKGKLPPEGLPRDLSEPGTSASVSRGGEAIPSDRDSAAPELCETTMVHEMAGVDESGYVEVQPQVDPTEGAPVRFTGDHPISTTLDDVSVSFPAWGCGTNIATTQQVPPGGHNDYPNLGTTARAQGQAAAQMRFFSSEPTDARASNVNPGFIREIVATSSGQTATTAAPRYGTSYFFSHDDNNDSTNTARFQDTNVGKPHAPTNRFDSDQGRANRHGDDKGGPRQLDDHSASILNGLIQLLRAADSQSSAPQAHQSNNTLLSPQAAFTRGLTGADFPLMDESNLKESLEFFEDSLRIYKITDSEVKLQAAQVVFSRSLMTGFYKEYRRRGLTYSNFRNYIHEKDIPTFGIHRAVDFAGFHRSANEILDFAWTAAQDPRPEIAKMLVIFCTPQQCHSQLMSIVHQDWPLFKRNASKIYTGFQKTPQIHHTAARPPRKTTYPQAPRHPMQPHSSSNAQTSSAPPLCYPHTRYGVEAYRCYGRGCPMESLVSKSKNE